MRTLASWMTILAVAAAAILGVVAGGDSRAQEAPRNDNFRGYEHVQIPFTQPEFTADLSTAGATTEPGEPGCAGASVWYVIIPEATTRIIIDTAGSDFGTAIGVYRITDFVPSPPGGSLEELACTGAPDAQVSLDHNMQTGQGLIAVQVGGWQGQSGNLRLRIACEPVCAPPNDTFNMATYLFDVPQLDELDTAGAALDAGEPRPCGEIGNTVWYRFDTFDRAGDVISVIATSAEFTPVIAAYKVEFTSVSPPGQVAFANLGCVVDPGQDFPALSFTTEPRTSYHIQVGGADATGGRLSVLIGCDDDVGCVFSEMPPPDDSETFPPGTGGGEEGTPVPGSGVSPPETGSGGYLPQRESGGKP